MYVSQLEHVDMKVTFLILVTKIIVQKFVSEVDQNINDRLAAPLDCQSLIYTTEAYLESILFYSDQRSLQITLSSSCAMSAYRIEISPEQVVVGEAARGLRARWPTVTSIYSR